MSLSARLQVRLQRLSCRTEVDFAARRIIVEGQIHVVLVYIRPSDAMETAWASVDKIFSLVDKSPNIPLLVSLPYVIDKKIIPLVPTTHYILNIHG